MIDKWLRVRGIVKPGYQVASGMASNNPYPRGTLEMQLPFFKQLGLDLSAFFLGTLNVSISPRKFQLVNPEFTFLNVKWSVEHPSESFSFSRCLISFENTKYDGLIYYPHPETKIGHFQDPTVLEIITKSIPKIGYEDWVNLEVNTDEINIF